MALLAPHRHLIAAKNGTIHVFGLVPLSTLLTRESDIPGAYAGKSSTFEYVVLLGAGFHEVADVVHSPCRGLHLDFLPGTAANQNPDQLGTVTVLQAAAGPTAQSVPLGVAGQIDTALTVGRSWMINQSLRYLGNDLNFYYNGYATATSLDRCCPSAE